MSPGAASSRARADTDVARTLDRVAVLVAAGVPPPRAWQLAGGRTGASRGETVRGPFPGPVTRPEVGAVLRVAERTGAPVAPALRALAAAVRRTAASDRAVRVALAGPRTSARVVLALPLLGLALGSLWGPSTLSTLTTTPIGWGCLAVAATLVAVGRTWTQRLVDAASPGDAVPGARLDAWAVAVSGGGSWAVAGAAVDDAFAGVPAVAQERLRLAEVLDLATTAGVPAAALLRSAADDLREDAAAEGLAAAERLAVRLVLPLGVCVLPAFVLVGVLPVVVGILSSTVGAVR